MHDPNPKRNKLNTKTRKCILVGYDQESKAYRLYSLEDRKIYNSRDVTFQESRTLIFVGQGSTEEELLPQFENEQKEELVLASSPFSLSGPTTSNSTNNGTRQGSQGDLPIYQSTKVPLARSLVDLLQPNLRLEGHFLEVLEYHQKILGTIKHSRTLLGSSQWKTKYHPSTKTTHGL